MTPSSSSKSSSSSKPSLSDPKSGKRRPSFEVFMTDSYIKHDDVYIPASMYKHIHGSANHVAIKHFGRKWFVGLTNGQRRRMRDGWRVFVEDNNIRPGDVLRFKLLASHPEMVVFKVEMDGRNEFVMGYNPSFEEGTPEIPLAID